MSKKETPTAQVSEAEDASPKRKPVKEITLPSGRKAACYKGRMKHFFNARRVAGADQEMFYYTLFAQLVEVDGKPIRADDWAEEPMEDGIALMNYFDGQAGNS